MANWANGANRYKRGYDAGLALVSTKSLRFDLDNGAGTTVDDVLLRPDVPITITAARAVYTDATTGTVAAGNFKIGTTVGGAEIVAATAYENTKAVGTKTDGTIVAGAVAAGTPVIVRHTGVAATQAGQAYVEIESRQND
jgi:predicted aconitase with swiveling domain